jgi:hypothetical protein
MITTVRAVLTTRGASTEVGSADAVCDVTSSTRDALALFLRVALCSAQDTQMTDALQMQMEVQKKLHEQLEVRISRGQESRVQGVWNLGFKGFGIEGSIGLKLLWELFV